MKVTMKIKWMFLRGIVVIMMLISPGLAQPTPVLAVETGFPGALSPPPRPFPTTSGKSVSISSGGMRSHHVDHTDRLIVKYKDSSLARAATLGSDQLRTLRARAGVALTHLRAISGNNQVFKLPQRMTLDEAQAIAEKLSADPGVEYAVPDRLMSPMQLPIDPNYDAQWHYKSPASDGEIAGINLPPAWDITTGSSSLVVGVIDTGIVSHADLQGRIVPGYNFISDPVMAGNGIGRSADASDLGDWVTLAESSDPSNQFYACTTTNSSWHGTHVAGTIGAMSNNSIGVTGINWGSKILPVRVLGKCGGYLSDVIDGMRWAAGLSVQGVPANVNPVKVLNVSLGGSGACDAAMQSTINDVLAAGAVVVVAAGNSSDDAANYSPAGCNGVVSVAAVNRAGGAASYTNYGQTVKIAAPGGEWLFSGSSSSVLSTLNTGATSPIVSPGGDTYGYYQGTSMATPHVTGVVSLMLSLQPTLTPTQVVQLLQATARPFPAATGSFGGDCTTSLCGAGIVDAYRAVQAVGSNAPVISATPLSLDFMTHQGDPNPPSQSIVFTNHGGGTLNWSVSSNAAWLHVSPAGGQESGTVTVSVDTSALTPAITNIGTITISAAGAANSPVTIPVTVKYLLKLHAPIPVAVSDHALAAVDGKVYVIGGLGGQLLGTLVQIYDTASDTWTTGAPKPTSAGAINAAVINGKIYIPGGKNLTTDEILGALEIYDPVSNQWSSGAPLPTPLSASAVEAVNGKLYVMGGQDHHQDSYNSMYVYDPNANSWNRLADMELGMSWNSSGVIDGKIYMFGVRDSLGIPKLAEVYDPGMNSWSAVGSLNIPRSYTCGAVLAGKLYTFGGYRFGVQSWLQDAEVYEPGTNAWSVTPLLLNQPRYGLKATTVGNSMYVMGGIYPIGGGWGMASTINESYDITPSTIAITFVAGPNGTLTGATSQTVTYGGSASQVTAVPTTGYHFVNWTGTSGFVTTTANPLTVTNVTTDMTITANFIVDPVNGACGSSNEQYFSIAPIANLCATGTASAVTGTGPWSWTCSGSNGGGTANCFAAMKGDVNGDGKVGISDGLKVLRIAVGLETATADIYAKADVAPLKDGKSSPDGVIDIVDALVILKKVVGLVNW